MKKVLLFLAEGFEIYEASAFIDVIGWNKIEGDKTTELYSCGLKKNVPSTFSQEVKVDFIIDEIDTKNFAALAIPGGFEDYNFYKEAFDKRFLALIKKFHSEGKIIASICTGALPIAK